MFNSSVLTRAVFDLGEENSFGNFFSAMMLAFTALISALIAYRHQSQGARLWLIWSFATLALAGMAIDEGAMLHDRLSRPIQERLQTSGVFYIGWTLPYLFLVFAAVFAGLPLLRSLPPRTRIRLIVAAALYVGAAMGMEMIEALLLQRSVPEDMTFRAAIASGDPPSWAILVPMEETGEMIAVALALRALLLHLTDDLGGARLTFGAAAPDGAP